MTDRDYDIALVLSGGNALGAYQAGAYQALQEHGVEPDWVAGASAGAINGAIICGNQPGQRLSKLRTFWGVDGNHAPQADAIWTPLDETRRTAAAVMTLAGGRPGLFVPRHMFGPWWNPLGSTKPSSLYDAKPLAQTLESLVDFDLLNDAPPRFSVTAVDVESGEDIAFDTKNRVVTTEHLRASSALLPAFEPVDIEGRLVGDAGISVNLPLDVVLSDRHDRPLLCIAIDLLPLSASRPTTLGATVARTQDLIFATQSRRAIASWQAIFDERARHGASDQVTLVHLDYADQQREVSGKAFDYSAASAAARWRKGCEDMAAILQALPWKPITKAGLTVYRPAQNSPEERYLQAVHWSLAPVRG
ncbi:NTE family protein [Sphingomonas zeicaulis]|uniref:patatin-like phospholipase family protein n=1 Tax=Sphingomonas zeicaulis TaxID=1632740 RepID=UPI003D1BBD61